MYLTIGDCHFTDKTIRSESIPAHFLPGFFEELKSIIKQIKPGIIKFCIPGDFLDIINSALWNYEIRNGEYHYNKKLLRPWDDKKEKVFRKAQGILQQILSTPDLQMFLEKFKEFSQEIAIPVEVYYIPRNHDYLIGDSPELREMVCKAFGLAENKNFFFKDVIYDEEIGLYISHGNEYDIYNTPEGEKSVTFGDAIMIELFNRLPIEFFLKTGDNEFSKKLAEILEVRPQRIALSFIQEDLKRSGIKKSVLEKLLLDILDDCFKNKFITDWLKNHQSDINLRPRAFFLYQIFIPLLKNLRPLRKYIGLDKVLSGIYKVLQLEMKENFNSIIKGKLADLLKSRNIKYFVFGHSHDFERSFINHGPIYLNLGTWLNQYHKANSNFRVTRKLSYLLFFEKGEKTENEFEIKQTLVQENSKN